MKKTLSIILCLMLLIGTVAVGGEGLAQLLVTKASAETYHLTLTAKCDAVTELIAKKEKNAHYSDALERKPYYLIKLYAWVEGLPADYEQFDYIDVDWFKAQIGSAQSSIITAVATEFGLYEGKHSAIITFERKTDNIADLLGEYYAKLTFKGTNTELDGVSVFTNKIKLQTAEQVVYARCEYVNGKIVTDNSNNKTFYEQRPDNIGENDDPFGFYLPANEQGDDYYYIVKYYTDSDRTDRTVVNVTINIWSYRNQQGVAMEVDSKYRYYDYLSESVLNSYSVNVFYNVNG